MSAKCYYLDTPPSYYDQTNTFNAISQLELFISDYPNSSNVIEAQNLISKLYLILEKKEFNIAKSYYKTGKYNSAIYAFNNFIENYPNSKSLEDVFYCQTKSYFELAKNSIEEKKSKRVKDAIFACDNFLLSFDLGQYNEEVKAVYQQLKEIENGL